MGRFIAGLDMAAVGSEFQRADCAPRSTLGDGRLTIIDWVQAGRYAAGLDPVVAMGGPSSPVAQSFTKSAPQWQWAANPATAKVRLMQNAVSTDGSLRIELEATGAENALAFSLRFDSLRWRFRSVSASDLPADARTYVNSNQPDSVGILLTLPPGQLFAAGIHQILQLNFVPLSGATATGDEFAFANLPVQCAVASSNAELISAEYFIGEQAVTADAGFTPSEPRMRARTESLWPRWNLLATILELVEPYFLSGKLNFPPAKR